MALKSIYRSHTCGELTTTNIGQKVRLSGWIHRKRDHGGVFFIDLRDHYGLVQLVVEDSATSSSPSAANTAEIAANSGQLGPDDIIYKAVNEEGIAALTAAPNESVLLIEGVVVARSAETINLGLPTGQVEVRLSGFIIESAAGPLPFQINLDDGCAEEKRLEFRFLDLRKQRLHQNITLRNAVIKEIRDKMHELGFSEFQTPILTASSPEGARDFVVPSRNHPGKFYALPQAPQQFKQLLMIAGFDRYFQIAPCFRDEDARADRAPGEFYQLDVEMSFVTQEDVFAVIEPLMRSVFSKFGRQQQEITAESQQGSESNSFRRITYSDAMRLYGSDKPDLRNPLLISDVTEVFADSGFSIFAGAIKHGAVVRAIPAPGAAEKPRSFFDNLGTYAQNELGAKGLGYVVFTDDGEAKGPIAKFLDADRLAKLQESAGIGGGDAVFFVCEVENKAAKMAGKVRDKLGADLQLLDQGRYEFCWITDFPMYEWNDAENKIDFSHNPFSMPQGGIEVLLAADSKEKVLAIKAFQYDLVCNGIELSSGAIRNHRLDTMYKAFEIAGYSRQDVDTNFKGMVKALSYGAPPHGGIAPGIDRMIMLLSDEENIREVIAFPLNQKGNDLLMGAPGLISPEHLKELAIVLETES